MTKGTFGDNLKREREMRGVSLDEVSAGTRIATRFLQAIENEQWDVLPGGVFNRGFVRAVARYLGLDEENIVAEYVLAANEHQSVPVWTGSPPAVTPEQPWLAWIIAAVVVVALLVGGWFGVRRALAWRAAHHAAANTAADSNARGISENTLPDIAPQSAPPNSATIPEAPADVTSSALVTNPPQTATPQAAPDSAFTITGPLELKIEVTKSTRLTVEADTIRVFEGTIKTGEDRTFTAKDRFDISARDAGTVVLELNGKTLAPIGPPGHAGKATLTREVLRMPGGGN